MFYVNDYVNLVALDGEIQAALILDPTVDLPFGPMERYDLD